MSAEIIQFVPKPNPNRISPEDQRAIALHEYVASAGYPVSTAEMKQFMADTAPSEYCADDSGDCA